MLRKTVGIIRELGALDSFCYAIDKTLSCLTRSCRLHCHYIVSQPVPANATIPSRLIERLNFVELTENSDVCAEMPIPEEVIRARFAQRAKCVGIFRDGEQIGYGWLSLGQYIDDEFRVDYLLPVPHSAFDFDVYVFEKFRLGRSFAYVWEGINQKLREYGVLTTYSRISRFNEQSIRSHLRLGANLVGRITILKLGRFEWFLRRNVWRSKFSASDSDRVRYSLPATPNPK